MNWDSRLSNAAAKEFRRLPKHHQQQITHAIEEMQSDPFRGDVIPIKSGRFKGALRKRVGRYRLVFSLDHAQHLIEVAAILLRNESTYK